MRRGNRRRVWRRCAAGANLLLWIGAVCALVVAGVTGILRACAPRPVPTVREVTVSRGGTLWGLAMRYRRAGQDPRALAVEIRTLNGLRPDQTIHPGMRLLVPDYTAGAAHVAQNVQAPG